MSLKFRPESPTKDNPALVQLMVLQWTGDQELPGPMMAAVSDTYVQRLN